MPCYYGHGCTLPGEFCWAGITQCANEHLSNDGAQPSSSPSSVPRETFSPSSAPLPTPSPVAVPTSSSPDPDIVVAYYKWTWPEVITSGGLTDATFSVAFNGWMNVDNILSQSSKVYDVLYGQKYVSFGGGTEAGRITAARLAAIDSAMEAGRFDQYVGVVYDVETGDSGLTGQLLQSLKLAKGRGFKTVVTVSHSAPYGIADAHTVMNGILQSEDVDYVSPQLYTKGTEPENDYDISQGYQWENYVNRADNVKIIVTIVDRTYYADAQRFFGDLGVTLIGFIQWRQV